MTPRTYVSVMEPNVTLGSRLRDARKNVKLTLQEVATHMEVSSHVIVSRWENGSREPDASTLARLADLYGVSVDALLGREPAHGTLATISPTSPAVGRTPLAESPERPTWVGDLMGATQASGEIAAAAIRWQAEIFCGEIKDLNEKFERRDERQEQRDSQHSALIQGLINVVANNNALLAETQAALQEARQESRETRDTILRLQALLDYKEDDPPARVSTDAENVAQWDGKRGPKMLGRITSEGGAATA